METFYFCRVNPTTRHVQICTFGSNYYRDDATYWRQSDVIGEGGRIEFASMPSNLTMLGCGLIMVIFISKQVDSEAEVNLEFDSANKLGGNTWLKIYGRAPIVVKLVHRDFSGDIPEGWMNGVSCASSPQILLQVSK